jgi:50S ribosomal protein L16 3-hydroxylase
MLKFPDNGNVANFLRDTWQKQPRFMPQAIADLPGLTAGEIAWLATQPDVESRLVLTISEGGKTTYRVEPGPFTEERLACLPEQDWTLLVQDVDKHLPELSRVFDEVSFVPSWRIDDLMVSVAAPGGSVGPHVDNYDVFLCQLSGCRNWKVARQNVELQPMPHEDLRLVEPFAAFDEYTANPGDVLYLPPGEAHWGVATSLCITYSIGMRAPTAGQLAAEFARATSDSPDLDRFYSDPDLTEDEGPGGRISSAALTRARQTLEAMTALDDTEFAKLLGATLTDPKAWLAPPTRGQEESGNTLARFREGEPLVMHGMAKLAWSAIDGQLLVFANGFALQTGSEWEPALLELSRNRRLDAARYPELSGSPAGQRLLRWLIESGTFDLDHEPEA